MSKGAVIKEKLTVIVGLGKTGFSCVRYLKKLGRNIAVMDSRDKPPMLWDMERDYPDVPLYLGAYNDKLLQQADEIVASPGVQLNYAAIGDIELFLRAAKAPIVAITGSNGKSTVTTLVGEMAKNAGLDVAVGGNLGTPALDLLQDKEPDLYVLELSSFQLETTYSLKAAASVILNITPDHLDRYADFAAYKAAKMRIHHDSRHKVIVTSLGFDDFNLHDNFLCQGDKKLLAASELYLKGRHQIANALAALALGRAVNVPLKAMLKTLKEFKGLEHRCEFVREYNGVSWYNDSKATNVGATEAALNGLGETVTGKLILIAGGQGKKQDFMPLKNSVKKETRAVILIGEDALKIAQALEDSAQLFFADNIKDAILKAAEIAQQGDAVLLSPACASFDMFNDFEHRGKVFKEYVRQL